MLLHFKKNKTDTISQSSCCQKSKGFTAYSTGEAVGKARNAKCCNPLEGYKYTRPLTVTSRNLIPKIYWRECNKIFTQGDSSSAVIGEAGTNPNVHQQGTD